MAGRPKIFEEQEVIAKAIDVFWTKGYEAASAEELLQAMKIGKGSFYLAFKEGKKELYKKSLEQFSKNELIKFNADLAKSGNPINFIKEFFLSMTKVTKERQLKGCYLGNAIVEMSNIDPATKLKAVKLLSKLENTLMNVIQQAQENGALKTKEPATLLARYLINLWNGINLTLRMYPNDPGVEEMIRFNLRVLR